VVEPDKGDEPACDEFFGDEIHAVTQRRHKGDVGVTVKTGKFRLGQILSNFFCSQFTIFL
jgi:hypothetical protein